jgi:hypothetical protein
VTHEDRGRRAPQSASFVPIELPLLHNVSLPPPSKRR